MSRASNAKRVRCYHCANWIEVSEQALSLSCPCCCKRIVIQDLVVTTRFAGTRVQTCGAVFVDKKGELSAASVQASGGITVLGSIKANVQALGPVIIGGKARWRGDCEAPKVEIEPGAVIEGGEFKIRPVREPIPIPTVAQAV